MADIIVRPTLGPDIARRMVDAAVSAAGEAGIAVGVAVVGSVGELVAFVQMSGAPLVAEELARDKAYTAVALGGMATEVLAGLAAGPDPSLPLGLVGVRRISTLPGGVPIFVDGALVGAVGVSGGAGAQDVAVAGAAVDTATGPAPARTGGERA